MASSHSSISLTSTNPNCESTAAAERGHSTIRNQNQEVIDILNSSTVFPSSCQYTGCVIYGIKRKTEYHLNEAKKKYVINCLFPIQYKYWAQS